MRIVRFRDDGGSVRRGEWTDDDVIEFGGEEYDPDAVDILPPVEPTKIVCVAANYIEHIKEAGRSIPEDLPPRPGFFLKGPNAVAGHGDTVKLPTPAVTPEELAGREKGTSNSVADGWTTRANSASSSESSAETSPKTITWTSSRDTPA